MSLYSFRKEGQAMKLHAALIGWLALVTGVAMADEDQTDFKVGEKLAARYQTGSSVVRPIFWPVHAPSGALLTANGPKDHPHHKSVWFCHGDVIPEGIELKNKVKGIEGVDF